MPKIEQSFFYLGNFILPDGNAACQRVIANCKLFELCGLKGNIASINYTTPFNEREIDGISCFPQKSKNKFMRIYELISAKSLRKAMRSRVSKNDLIILYNAPSSVIFAFLIFSKIYKLNIVLDLTEYYSSEGMSFFLRGIKSLDTFIRMNILVKFVDGVITTSPFLTKKYKNINLNQIELPTLFECSSFKKPIINFGNTIELLYCGNPFNVKRKMIKERLDILIKSISSSSNIFLNIIGTSEINFTLMYPELVTHLKKIENKYTFHGFLPRKTVLDFLKKTDFQVFFRDKTLANRAGFPTKLSESISAGALVITSDMDGIDPYRNHKFIFTSKVGDETELLEKCLKLSRKEINILKNEAHQSKIFDYSNFEKKAKKFIKSFSWDI